MERGALSHSGSRRAWREFVGLTDIFWPTTKHFHEVERELAEAKEAVAAGQEGATTRLEVVKEEFNLVFILSNSAMEFHLRVKKDQ